MTMNMAGCPEWPHFIYFLVEIYTLTFQFPFEFSSFNSSYSDTVFMSLCDASEVASAYFQQIH